MSIIQDVQLDIGIIQLKHALKDLGYNHWIAQRQLFLKKLDCNHRLLLDAMPISLWRIGKHLFGQMR